MSDPYAIDPAACRMRQGRLLEVMRQLRLDVAIVTQHAHVQYLIGPRYAWTFAPTAALLADGRTILVAPSEPNVPTAADEVVTYEAQSFSTSAQRSATQVVASAARGTGPAFAAATRGRRVQLVRARACRPA